MCGTSAVASAADRSTQYAHMFSFALIPFTVFSAKTRAAFVRIIIDSSTLCAMTGIITLSSSCPCSAAIATRASSPDDLEADLVHHLGNRRIDLAGHDRRPGLHRGQRISSMPVRGPITMSRRSLAILLSRSPARELRAERRDVAHALHELNAILADAQIDP